MNAEQQQYISMLQAPGEEERLQGLKGLARSGADACMPMLYAALGDASWRVRKEAAAVFLSLPRAGELAGEIIELLHSPDNAGLRNTAVEILISLGRRAIPFLLEEVSCADRDVRKFVLDILGEIGGPVAVPAMIQALDDADENVRAAAAENLGKVRSAQAVPALLSSLARPELLFRFTVLEALGQIGTAVGAEALVPLWEEKLLRKALADCLGRIGGAEAVPVLIGGLNDRMRNVREASALALARLGAERPAQLDAGLDRIDGAIAKERLGELLESGSSEVRRAAVQLVQYLGSGQEVTSLLALLEQEDVRESAVAALVSLGRANPALLTRVWPEADARTRVYLAYLFGEAGCDAAGDLLLEGLTADDADLRSLSARALGRVGNASAMEPLLTALGDAAEEVRDAALQSLLSLCRRHREHAGKLLEPLLEHENPEQRMFAATLCGALEGQEAEARLGLALKDESPLVRRAAVRAFAGRAIGRHFSVLVLALTDEDAEVRRLTVDLLGIAGDPQAIRPLELALGDEDPWVRAAAVRALGRLDGEPVWMEVALADPVGLVVIAALEVAAAKGGGRAAAWLLQALVHPDEEVIRACLHLLPGLAEPDWIEIVRRDLLHHPHREVRLAAAELLAERHPDSARAPLEGRLLVDGDELVRQRIRDLLTGID